MRILAISGSLRASSTNTALVRAIAALTPEHMEIILYNDLAALPHFSPEIDDDNPPASVIHLREQLQAADGVLICTPEYAFGVPGSLKMHLIGPSLQPIFGTSQLPSSVLPHWKVAEIRRMPRCF